MNHNYPLYSGHSFYGSFERFVDGIAELYGEKTAITYRVNPRDKEPIKVSYRTFACDVHALANEMFKKEMSGKHCALIGRLSYEWVCSYIALQMIGAVVVPLDKEWTAEELSATISFAECQYVICDADLEEKSSLICKENGAFLIKMNDPDKHGIFEMMGAGDPYWKYTGVIDTRAMSTLVFTSGTTGKGKGVMLCQDGILSDIYNGLKIIHAGERSIVSLPPHHTYGSNIGIIALLYAGANIYISSGLKYIVQEMKEVKPDFMVLVPLYVETFHRRICSVLRDSGKEKLVGAMKSISNALRHVKIDVRRRGFKQILDSFGGELEFIVSGGAPLRPELVRDFESFGISLLNGYGITECSPLISVNRNDYNCIGSVGVPIPSMDVKIDNPNEDGEGEICVRGSNVMLGYYKEPEATAAVIDDQHYFHTGDIGRIDENGVIYITGRIKNLIILSNGKNVYPEEIETAISSISGVSDVVVYEGVSRRGSDHNKVVAEIYPDYDYLQKNGIEDANEYFKRYISEYNRSAVKYKQVGYIKVRKEDFPKNTLRKITRFKLDMSIE